MDIIKVKPTKNKANGQITFSLSKKNLPIEIKKLISKDSIPNFKFKFEGIEF